MKFVWIVREQVLIVEFSPLQSFPYSIRRYDLYLTVGRGALTPPFVNHLQIV